MPTIIEKCCSLAVAYLAFALTLLSSVKGQCIEAGLALSGTTGSISSPNYPSNYPNSETCRWIITVPEGHLVHLNFVAFVMEKCALSSPICNCDHVQIRDGTDGNSPKLATYCGDKNPGAVMSSGRFMWVEFDSDLFFNDRGFEATYTAVAASECPRNGMLSGTNGSFSSPQYPLSYPNSVKCTWIIEVPAGHKVRLQFDSFRLETCTVPSACTCDHVEVRDGRDESARSLGKFCGDNGPSILRSSGQQLWVEFDSDSLTRATGFSASFKAVPESECPSDGYILRGTNGSISSPEYPLSYPNSVKCTWIIEVPAGHQVRLQFDSFRLETCAVPSVCTCDHVEVRDGGSSSSESLKKLCGDIGPSLLRSTGQQLWVEFESDSKTTQNGFHASFKAVPESECPRNGVLQGTNGSVSSPEYPLSYPDSAKCTWIIEVPEGFYVRLEFDFFQLETCTPRFACTCDHVEVRDGQDESAKSLQKSCGDKTPFHLRSSGRFLWIEFESDSRTTRNGFHASFKAVSEDECPTRGVLRGKNGSFSSPEYPLNYPNSVTCTWIIEVPEGYHVQLVFDTFQLEDCAISSLCTCDHVEVRDGQTDNSPSLKKHCGNKKPAPLRSSGRFMWVEFDSDSKTTEKGFNASFTAVSDSDCPNNGLLTGKVGNFSSPGYPSNYPNSVTCTWVIEVPENYLVELTFDTFELEDCFISSLCTCDHVEVRDGQDGSADEIDEFCGDDKPSTLLSTGRYMWVEFESDSRTTRKGFRATYKAIKTGMYCHTEFGWNISSIGCIAATVAALGGGIFFIVLVCIVVIKKPKCIRRLFRCHCECLE